MRWRTGAGHPRCEIEPLGVLPQGRSPLGTIVKVGKVPPTDDLVEIVTDRSTKIAKQIAENVCGNHNAFAS